MAQNMALPVHRTVVVPVPVQVQVPVPVPNSQAREYVCLPVLVLVDLVIFFY